MVFHLGAFEVRKAREGFEVGVQCLDVELGGRSVGVATVDVDFALGLCLHLIVRSESRELGLYAGSARQQGPARDLEDIPHTMAGCKRISIQFIVSILVVQCIYCGEAD